MDVRATEAVLAEAVKRKPEAAQPATRTVKASAIKGLQEAQSGNLARALAEANRAHPLFKKKR